MDRLGEIRQLYAFDRWANARMLDAAAALPETALLQNLGSSHPSVRDTLAHIVSSYWIWLSRWHGTSPRAAPEGWSQSTMPELRAHWQDTESQQQRFLAALDEAGLDRVVDYTTLTGASYSQPLWQLLRHVVNHATYHRGQVVTMLRQLGTRPPSTDLVEFFRTQVLTVPLG